MAEKGRERETQRKRERKKYRGNAMSVREIDLPMMLFAFVSMLVLMMVCGHDDGSVKRVRLTSLLIWFHSPIHIGTFPLNTETLISPERNKHVIPSQIQRNILFICWKWKWEVVAHSNACHLIVYTILKRVRNEFPSDDFSWARSFYYTPSTSMKVIEIMIYSTIQCGLPFNVHM